MTKKKDKKSTGVDWNKEFEKSREEAFEEYQRIRKLRRMKQPSL